MKKKMSLTIRKIKMMEMIQKMTLEEDYKTKMKIL